MGIIKNKFLQLTQWGPPSSSNIVLQEESIDTDNLNQDDILVKIKYAPIHPADINVFLKNFTINYNVRNNILPAGIGIEAVGEVQKVGSSVKGFQVGDLIAPRDPEGKALGYNQYVIAKDGLKIPSDIKLEDAAQVVINPKTAVGLLDELGIMDFQGRQHNNEDYLAISGANSVVGQVVLQLAKIQGLKTIAIVRNPDAIDTVKSLGATETIVTQSITNAQELTQKIKQVTNNRGIRYGLDCVGGHITSGLFDSLTTYGHLVYFGNESRQDITINAFSYRALPKLEGYNNAGYYNKVGPQRQQEAINFLFDQLRQGNIKIPVEKVFPFEQYMQAFQIQAEGTGASRKGKFLLKFD